MIDPPMIRPEAVLTAYCRITGVLIADLTGPSKAAPIVKRRHELIYLLAQMTVLSQTDIGRRVGNRDQATVQAAIQNVADRLAADPAHAERLRDIARIIRDSPPAAPVDVMRTAALGVLADRHLSDADARHAALVLLSAAPAPEVQHGR